MGNIIGDVSFYDCCNPTTACGESFQPYTQAFAAVPYGQGISCWTNAPGCGANITMHNICTGGSLTIPVYDHVGPDVHCQSLSPTACTCATNLLRLLDISYYAFHQISQISFGHFPATLYW